MKLALSAVLTIIFLTAPIRLEADPAWVARYDGGSGEDQGTALAPQQDGSVYVVGSSEGANGLDYLVIKYSATGVVQWVARYDAPSGGEDVPIAIAVDAAQNVFVTGWSAGVSGTLDYATVKYNAAGEEQWTARYNGPANGWDEAFSIGLDATGDVYVTGASVGNMGYPEITTVKYSGASGGLLWSARYVGGANVTSESRGIAIDPTGDAYVVGWRSTFGDTTGASFDFVTIKYSSQGAELWERLYDGPNGDYDRAYDVETDTSGNAYVTGLSQGITTGLDCATIKYAPTGAELWVTRFDGSGMDDGGQALALAPDGVVICGVSATASGSFDFVTVKYSSGGAQQWYARYSGPSDSDDRAIDIAVSASGETSVAGGSTSTDGSSDYVTVKYDAGGAVVWEERYDGVGAAWDDPLALAVDGSGGTYVTGLSYGTAESAEDCATIKYGSTCSHLADHVAGNVRFSVTNRGSLGFTGDIGGEGSGFVYPRTGGANRLYIGSFVAATDTSYVLNRDYSYDPVLDWEATGCLTQGPTGDWAESWAGVYTDAGHPSPRGLEVRQKSYAWADATNDDYLIIIYQVVNGGTQAIADLRLGCHMDWDLNPDGGSTQNAGASDADRRLIYMWREGGGDGVYVGVEALLPRTPPTMNFVHNPTHVYPLHYLQDADRYHFLAGDDPAYVVPATTELADWSAMLGLGPLALAPGDTGWAAVAVLGGGSLAALLANADAAQLKFESIWGTALAVEPPTTAPEAPLMLSLAAGRPNPFGGETVLDFTLPQGGPASVKIYDAAGRYVATLVERVFDAGQHATVWDGRHEDGSAVSAGVYFARIESGGREAGRRIVVLR